jgi:hypothetical protein
MAKDLLFKLRSVTLSNEERRRDIAAELEARGHLNERGKTFAAKSVASMRRRERDRAITLALKVAQSITQVTANPQGAPAQLGDHAGAFSDP